MTTTREVHAGFIPLTDCAPLAVAKELGFDSAHGIDLVLHREVSWANIRDKAEAALFDCAIMLAPMPLASTLGLGGRPPVDMLAAMATSLNGSAITVSNRLHVEMLDVGEAETRQGGMAAARALARVVRRRQSSGGEPLTLGMVYPFSCHNYDLRCWLASAGIDPDHDVNMVVVPPPLIAGSLKSGRIDGFCVGEPWNSVAVTDDSGVILATKAELWPRSPEKVLGLRADYAARNPDKVTALVRAVSAACAWLDDPAHHRDAARILAAPDYIGVDAETVLRGLDGGLRTAAHSVDDETIIFARDGANVPLLSHAAWLLTQMIRWGQVRSAFEIDTVARTVFRQQDYVETVAAPRVAGEPGIAGLVGNAALFAAWAFDPADPIGYLSAQRVRDHSVDLSAFVASGRPSG